MQNAQTVIRSRVPAEQGGRWAGPRRRRPARRWDTDRAGRARAYRPSSCVPNLEPYLRQYAEGSARARAQLAWLALRYGPQRCRDAALLPGTRGPRCRAGRPAGSTWHDEAARGADGPPPPGGAVSQLLQVVVFEPLVTAVLDELPRDRSAVHMVRDRPRRTVRSFELFRFARQLPDAAGGQFGAR